MNSLVDQEDSKRPNPSNPDPPTTEATKPGTSDRAQKAAFKNEWHDAKEIVVPFDDSGFSGLLVSEKEFAAAYAPKTARPPMESLRLETGRTVGRIVSTPSFPQRAGQMTVSLLSVIEKLLMALTPVLLLTAVPLTGWWPMISAGAWIAILWAIYRFGSRPVISLWVWVSGLLATLGVVG